MPLRFLVVDDEPITAAAFAQLLTSAFSGCEVRTAHSNDQALELLAHYRPNLVTSDLVRPGGAGFSFLHALRQDPSTEFTPVLAISGNADKLELAAWRAGFSGVLRKPVSTEKILQEVSRVLQLRSRPDTLLIHLGYETQGHDYKKALDLTSKDAAAAFAKDVIAFANYGGGLVIVGVRESNGEFQPFGITESEAARLETTRVNRAIRNYIDPPVAVSSERVWDGPRLFVFLRIPAAVGTLVLASKQNEKAGLFPGRIYTRTAAVESAEVRHSVELRRLIDRLTK